MRMKTFSYLELKEDQCLKMVEIITRLQGDCSVYILERENISRFYIQKRNR